MIPTNPKAPLYKLLATIAVLLIYCFGFQGERGLFEKDEGRYTAIALNMLSSGDWIHPRLNSDLEHWSKPPLTYWAIASSIRLLGQTEFAARLPGAAAFLGSILALYLLGLVFLPQRKFYPPLIYATFFFVVTASNMITTDGLLTFFEVGAVACFCHAYWIRERRKLFSLGMWFLFSLAFLTKGPPGLMPLLSIVLFLNIVKDRPEGFRMNWLPGFLIFLVVGGGWYFWVMGEKATLAHYFLQREVVDRVFSAKVNRNDYWYSFLYIYIPILIAGTLPWTKFVWTGCWQVLQQFRRQQFRTLDAMARQELFLLLWFLVPLSIFTIARSRLALYVLPLFAPLAIFGARELVKRGVSLEKWRGRIALWAILMLAVRLVGGAVPLRSDASWYARELKKVFPERVDAIVFVDKRPVMGLRFYTNAQVKMITMRNNTLENELAKPAKRLWVLKPEHGALFQQKSVAAGHPVIFVGPLHWDQEYYLFVEK